MSDDKTIIMPPEDGDDRTRILNHETPSVDQGESDLEKTTIRPNEDDQTVVFDLARVPTIDQSSDHDQTEQKELGVGSIIKDRFVLDRLLGFGGMGAVYRALDKRKQEAHDEDPYVAIKLLGQDFKDHPQAFVTLQRETKKTQELAHPNIVTVYDFDRDGDVVYMTMEELKGVNLEELIKQHEFEKMPLEKALTIVRGIAEGLAYAHSKGIIHSDLKPGNIFVTDDGKVKVLDFGIARVMEQSQDKSRFDAGELGALSPRYASVEMINQCPPDPRDDIYALGIIACELISGGHPYKREMATDAVAKGMEPSFEGVGRLLKGALAAAVTNDIQQRSISCEQWLKKLDFAVGGYKKWILGIAAGLVFVIANLVYLDYAKEPEFALSDLTQTEQTLFASHMEEARLAIQFNDINGALFYLDKAYGIHSQNSEVSGFIETVLARIRDQIESNRLTSEQVNEIIMTLNEYTAFSNEKIQKSVASLRE